MQRAVTAVGLALTILSISVMPVPGLHLSMARAADEAGVARMQACTPTSADFVSLEAAPEVSGAIPISAGMHRLWDLGVTWKDVNPAPGTFTWTALDAQVAKAEASGARPLLVLGMTPTWAAANPGAGDPRWGLGTASPPRDINDWRAYVSAVVDRYGSRIAAYEVWNEANLATFWAGTADQMAELTAAAYGIIKAKQPAATVLLPSVTLRLRPSMRRFMNPFLVALGARNYPFDAFAIHTYPAGNLGPQDRVNDIVYWQSTVVNQVGSASPILDRPTFDTEVNFGLAGPGATPGRAYSDAEGAALIRQTYLDSRNLGIDATFWYLYTAAPYSLLGVQLWQGAPEALAAWQSIGRVFAAGTPCPTAGAPDPFEVDRQLAAVATARPDRPGAVTVQDNGQPVGSVPPPVITGASLAVTDAGWSLSAQAPTVRSTAAFGSPVGGTVTLQGAGYAPASTLYIWLGPSTFLGAVRTDPKGAFSTSVTLPPGAAAGDEVLQVNGFRSGGGVRSTSIGMRVFAVATSPARATVAFTGGRRKLDAAARDALRDLVTAVPKGARTSTLVTAYAGTTGSKRQARALARKRAGKITAYLSRAGLTGSIVVRVRPGATRSQEDRAGVEVTWTS